MTWKVKSNEHGTHIVYDDEDWYVMSCQNKRRAQLIAQAPVLLEALEAIRNQVECYMQPLPDGVARRRWEAVRDRAVDAIAAVKEK